MMNNWTLHIENRRVILSNGQEEKELVDFGNKQANLCHISREIQMDLYTQLWNIITQAGLSEEMSIKQLAMHALLMRTISSVEDPLNILIMGDAIFIKNSTQYADIFNKDTIVYTLPLEEDDVPDKNELTPSLVEYIRMIGVESKKKCNVVYLDYWMIGENTELFLAELDQILDFEGLIFLSSAPKEIQEWNGFSLEEHYVLNENNKLYLLKSKKDFIPTQEQKKLLSHYQEIFNLIQKQWKEIKVLTTRDALSKEKELEEQIDKLILFTADLETFVNKNHMLIVNKDIKYEVNELKNALLDLRYSFVEEWEYFLGVVDEQMERVEEVNMYPDEYSNY